MQRGRRLMAWRHAAAVLALLSAGLPAALAAGLPDPNPRAAASYIVVLDGRPLWAHEPAARRQPASLAKLLTALVLLDRDWHPEAPVTVSARAAAIEGSRAGLRAGESLSASDALTALLVRSANDACVALAEHAAGSLEAFAGRMNALGARLGLQDSRFVHPCGLDAPGQHTSARDLLRIASAAYEAETIRRIVAMPAATVRTLGGRTLTLRTGNALIGRLDGAVGMKSGYTSGAGKCIVAVVERRGHRAWLVMLGAPERWWTAAGMLDAAFRELGPEAGEPGG